MQEFTIQEDHSCNKCGAPIKNGDTVYADNWDRVRNGGALCEKCFKKLNEPVEPAKATGGKSNKSSESE